MPMQGEWMKAFGDGWGSRCRATVLATRLAAHEVEKALTRALRRG